MKKTLLFLAAASIATAASAQLSEAVNFTSVNAKAATSAEECSAIESSFLGNATNDVEKDGETNVKAWYIRPAGTFYLSNYSTEGKAGYSAFYAPYLMMRPYEEYVFYSASANAKSEKWKVWYQEKMQPKSLEMEAKNISNAWPLEVDTVPQLTATGENNTQSVFQLAGYYQDKMRPSYLSTYPGYPGQVNPSTTEVRHIWASPKFFAYNSNRDGTVTAGAYYSTIQDESGNPQGNLLGKNTANIDAMAIAVEKPTHPYAIKAVGVRFQSLKMASNSAKATIVANIYKVAEIPTFKDTYVTITPGEKIATSSITLSNLMILNTPEYSKNSKTGKYSGVMYLPLENELNVDEPIMVEITGYNVDGIEDFTSLYSADSYEEGYGEIGYIKIGDKYVSLRGSYFKNNVSTAPAIVLEVENPFFTWNYSNETGEGTFATEGETKNIEMFTYKQAADMKITAEDGGALPNWVSATTEDVLKDGAFAYLSTLNVTAEALPAGTNYREASIKVVYPGAKLIYTVKQGDATGIKAVTTSGVEVKVVDGDFAITCTENCAVEIYSVAGQLVRKAQASQGTSVVSAQDLANGVYIVKVDGNTVKVVK